MLKTLTACWSLMLVMASSGLHAENLFDEQSYQALTGDYRALSVGDTVTLLIVENAKAQSVTDSAVNEGVSLSGSVGKSDRTELGSVQADVGRNSGAATNRKGQLQAQLTAVVREIDRHGKLYIIAKQSITINGEEQLIKARGWIRPRDITNNNTVLSTRLGDAHIEYTGVGPGSDTAKPGVLHWIADKIGLI